MQNLQLYLEKQKKIKNSAKHSAPTRMLQSPSETALEHPLCFQHPYPLDTGSSLREQSGLKGFYKHPGHGDTKNTHCCNGKSSAL